MNAGPPIDPPEREIEDIDPNGGGYDTVKEAEGWA